MLEHLFRGSSFFLAGQVKIRPWKKWLYVSLRPSGQSKAVRRAGRQGRPRLYGVEAVKAKQRRQKTANGFFLLVFLTAVCSSAGTRPQKQQNFSFLQKRAENLVTKKADSRAAQGLIEGHEKIG